MDFNFADDLLTSSLERCDPVIHKIVSNETFQQFQTISMIASENTMSKAVRECSGSAMANKYAEGYPGKRYYHGVKNVDAIEEITIARTLTALHLDGRFWSVNVQSYSGSLANNQVYEALIPRGGKILSMHLFSGGHLSHGYSSATRKVSQSAINYDFSHYSVNPSTDLIDYDSLENMALEIRPALIVAGASSYPRQIDYKRMRQIANACNAMLLVDASHVIGLIITKVLPSPFPYADVVTTTTHKTLRGPRGALIISRKQYGMQIDRVVFPQTQGGPHFHTITGIAVALHQSMTSEFSETIKNTVNNAKLLAGTLLNKGFRIVTKGTDNHIVLVDVAATGIPADFAAKVLEAIGIIVNVNFIPRDANKADQVPSGIRFGTSSVTSRGITKQGMIDLIECIAEVLQMCKHFCRDVYNITPDINCLFDARLGDFQILKNTIENICYTLIYPE